MPALLRPRQREGGAPPLHLGAMLVVLLAAHASGAAVEAATVDSETLVSSPTGYTALTFGQWTSGTVTRDGWVDFFVVAPSDEESIEFEVVADTHKPAALGIYVNEAVVTSVGSDGMPTISTPLHDGEEKRSQGLTAAALDSDVVSQIGNSKTRNYYAYISQCYVMKGRYYFLSVYGQLYSSAVSFQVRATRSGSAVGIGTTSGRVCDGKYMHHHFDLAEKPHSGGIQFHVQKRSGELSEVFMRYEKCGGECASKGCIYTGTLAGHGLTSTSITLPKGDVELKAGRYYLSVRGATELCGEYDVTLRNLTQADVTADLEEV